MDWNIVHKRQEKSYSCSAACYSMLLGIEEKLARKECQTKSSGTYDHNVAKALKERQIPFIRVGLDTRFRSIQTHLKLLSKDYPIFVSGHYISNCGKGRNKHRHHATLVWKGQIFDPSENFETLTDCYEHTFNKDFLIKSILIIGVDKSAN